MVSGDVAQCITVSNTRETRTRFLYSGSQYSNKFPEPHFKRECSEFHDSYVPLHFFSTLAAFTNGTLTSVSELECGIALFPKIIREGDLDTLARWVDHNLGKSLHGSVWATNDSCSYNEFTLAQTNKENTWTRKV
jgi:hypothetical protein